MNKSSDVENFIDKLPNKRRIAINKIREMSYAEYPEIEEVVGKNILNFKLNDINMFVFGSQKQYMCFYFSKALMLKYKEDLKGLNLGKGTIRFNDIKKINEDTLKSIIVDAREFPFEYSKRGDSTR